MYTPGRSVRPPPSGEPVRIADGVRSLQVLYVVSASAWEATAMAEPTSVVVATPGGKPVMPVPGDRQMDPDTMVKPELVIVDEALTPQSFEFAPRARAVVASGAWKRTRARRRIGSMI